MGKHLLLYDNGRDFRQENGYVSLAYVGNEYNEETDRNEDILISGRTWTDEEGFTFNFSQDGYYVMDVFEMTGLTVPNKGDLITLVDERPEEADGNVFRVSGYSNVYATILSFPGANHSEFRLGYTDGEIFQNVGRGIEFKFLNYKEKVTTKYTGKLKNQDGYENTLTFIQSGDSNYYYCENALNTWGQIAVKSGVTCFVPNYLTNRNAPQMSGKMYNTSGQTRSVNIKSTSADTTDLTAITMTIFKSLDGTEEVYASAYTPGDYSAHIIKGDPDAGIWVTTSWQHVYNQNCWLNYFDGNLSSYTESELTEADVAVTSIKPGVAYETKGKEVFYNPTKTEYNVVWKAPNMFRGSFSPQTHANFDELFPMIDDFFSGSKKVNVDLYAWFEPGCPACSYAYPDPKACNFMHYGEFSNNGMEILGSFEIGGGGCESYFISYDKQTRTITFAVHNDCI